MRQKPARVPDMPLVFDDRYVSIVTQARLNCVDDHLTQIVGRSRWDAVLLSLFIEQPESNVVCLTRLSGASTAVDFIIPEFKFDDEVSARRFDVNVADKAEATVGKNHATSLSRRGNQDAGGKRLTAVRGAATDQ
jgi:hypothetical protein